MLQKSIAVFLCSFLASRAVRQGCKVPYVELCFQVAALAFLLMQLLKESRGSAEVSLGVIIRLDEVPLDWPGPRGKCIREYAGERAEK